jgi:hypothetical protein
MTAAEWMFGIIKKTLTLTIGTELFNTVGVRHLLLLNKGSITLSCLVHDYLKLRHWIRVIEEAAVCMRAHCAGTKQGGAVATKKMGCAIFFGANNGIVVF